MKHRLQALAQMGKTSFDPGLNVLLLAAFPLVLWLFQDSAVSIVIAVIEMALLATALRLIATGQKEQRDYDAAAVAIKPRLPRKTLGSLLIGVMVLILAGMHFDSLLLPLLLGLIAFGLGVMAFGLDPMQDKGLDDPDVLARLEAADYVDLVEEILIELSERVAVLGDTELTLRTDAARNMATRITRALSSDLRVLARLRKPISKFIEIFGNEVDRLEASRNALDFAFARRRYLAKIQVLAESFEDRARRGGVKSGRDVFDMEADMLLGRMPRESAA
ncbi:hypothetical protein [Tropicibacter oceani]|uniref:5-bromo-4-chloroindolyl phosphate hydrolase n=1 Tax=Tropicibacter oceani TaxID=3058420 RepID=A0ABY8QNE2_9RHOB|nr:hypothetical protein [Tropicibacter oceani]WGW05337.1 hypothetical protein QF118_07260 [Tropicibacter oceani]